MSVPLVLISVFVSVSGYLWLKNKLKNIADFDKLAELKHPFSAQSGVLIAKEKYVNYEDILSKYDLDPVKYDDKVPHCSNVDTCVDREPHWCKQIKIGRPSWAHWACYRQDKKMTFLFEILFEIFYPFVTFNHGITLLTLTVSKCCRTCCAYYEILEETDEIQITDDLVNSRINNRGD